MEFVSCVRHFCTRRLTPALTSPLAKPPEYLLQFVAPVAASPSSVATIESSPRHVPCRTELFTKFRSR